MNDYEKISRLRDELRLKMHLASAETRDLFEQLEQKWHELRLKLRPVGTATAQAAGEITEAARLLLDELRAGYHKVEQALKRVCS